jgi:ACS family tartrate transporter-like MFS transporter
MMAWARSSDRRRERLWHAVLALLLAATGFVAASVVQSNLAVVIALTCTAIGVLSVYAPLNCLVKSRLGGPAVASGVALYNSLGSLGGFAGSYVIGAIRQATGSYALGMMAIAVYLVLCAVMLFLLGRSAAPAPRFQPAPAA